MLSCAFNNELLQGLVTLELQMPLWWNDLPISFYTIKYLPCAILGLMMSYPPVFGFDINPGGILVLVDVFGVVFVFVFGMVFNTLPPLDDWSLFNLPNSAEVAKSFPPPKRRYVKLSPNIIF